MGLAMTTIAKRTLTEHKAPFNATERWGFSGAETEARHRGHLTNPFFSYR